MSDDAPRMRANPLYAFLFLLFSFAAGLVLAYVRTADAPLVAAEPAATEAASPGAASNASAVPRTAPPSIDPESGQESGVEDLRTDLGEVTATVDRLEAEVEALRLRQSGFDAALAEHRDLVTARLSEVAVRPDAAPEAPATHSALPGSTETRPTGTGPTGAGSSAADAPVLGVDLARLNARPTARGYLVTLTESELRFPVGSSELAAGRAESLSALAEVLGRHERLVARVLGHTDSSGSAASNLQLSRARALSVKSALMELGVDGDRIEADGLGESSPVTDNDTPESRGNNRRVEVYLVEPS